MLYQFAFGYQFLPNFPNKPGKTWNQVTLHQNDKKRVFNNVICLKHANKLPILSYSMLLFHVTASAVM